MSEIFRDDELAEWRGNGLDPDEADLWWDALVDRLGPPETWPLADNERPRRFTLSYALSWHAEGFDNFDQAEPWLTEFPVVDGAAEARAWRDAGWGPSTTGEQSVVEAGQLNAQGATPDQAPRA